MKKVLLILGLIVLVSGCIEPITIEGYCIDKESGKRLSLSEAKQIAINSECNEQGKLKDTQVCNEDTGTWWIDLDIEKEGCNPACVIDIETKTAKINWRCTGVLPG